MIDEDAPVRAVLSTFGPETLADLGTMAAGRPTEFYRALITRPDLRRLTIWLVDSSSAEEVQERVLRALRDLSAAPSAP
jgi:hypothetical protein